MRAPRRTAPARSRRTASGGRRPAGFVLAFILALSSSLPLASQSIDLARRFSSDVQFGALFPMADYSGLFGVGMTGQLKIDFAALPWLTPSLRIGFDSLSPKAGSLDAVQAGLGLGGNLRLGERIDLGLDASAGLGLFLRRDSGLNSSQIPLLAWQLGLSLGGRLSPAFDVALGGGLKGWSPLSFSSGLAVLDPLLVSAETGLTFSYRFGSMGQKPSGGRGDGDAGTGPVRIGLASLKPVFPVFNSYYDSSPFGEIELVNGEDSAIRDVKVWFESGEYMKQPKLCATVASIAPGASARLPLYALFSEDILDITENGTIEAAVRVDYRLLGAAREAVAPVTLTLFHRNAMNWTDDRRAAAFASPTDPSVLWFSRFVAGMIADRGRPEVDRNLQLGMGLFEAERLYGINYVVDPSSSYVDNADDENSVDYLQFPHQTLAFRGGDCDDLSILYVSLLESLGVKSAFITIPGHIYAAFALSVPEAEAREAVYDPELLVYEAGKAWVPVEITMIKDGFVKAWRVGAKEWYDNAKSGMSKLYSVEDAWKLYPPAGIKNAAARFALPDEAALMQAFDASVDRYVVREIDGEIRKVAADPTKPQTPETENRLGLVYARNGMLKEAWTHFSAAAKGGYLKAWVNLAGVAFLRRDWELAAKYYDYARSLDASDDVALLGSARSWYEMERFDLSDESYGVLEARNPALAAKFGYLASKLGGEGRAWSLSERLSSTVWSDTPRATAVVAAPPQASASTAVSAAAAKPEAVKPEPVTTTVAKLEPEPQAPTSPVKSEDAETPPAKDRIFFGPSAVAAVESTEKAVTTSVPQAVVEEPAKATPEQPVSLTANLAPAIEGPAQEVKPAEATAPRGEVAAFVPPPDIVDSVEDKDIRDAAASAARAAASLKPAETIADAQPVAPQEAFKIPEPTSVPPPATATVAIATIGASDSPATMPEPAPAPLADVVVEAEGSGTTAAETAPAETVVAETVPAEIASVEIAHVEPAPAETALVATASVEPAPVQAAAAANETAPEAALVVAEPPAAAEEGRAASVVPVVEKVPAAEGAELALVESASSENVVAPETPDTAHPEAVATAANVPVEPYTDETVSAAPAQAPAEVASTEVASAEVSPVAAPVTEETGNEAVPMVAEAETFAAEDLAVKAETVPSPTEPVLDATRMAPPVAEVAIAPALNTEEAKPEEAQERAADMTSGAPLPATVSLETRPAARLVTEGLKPFKAEIGTWAGDDRKLVQLSASEYFAKAVHPLMTGAEAMRYSFEARSLGEAWVGYGLHVAVQDVVTHKGYGEGESWLVWITSDPTHLGNAATHVQLYRSRDDINMTKVSDLVVDADPFRNHAIVIDVDPSSGGLVASIDGVEVLKTSGLEGLGGGSCVVLRALDKTEFGSFKAEELK